MEKRKAFWLYVACRDFADWQNRLWQTLIIPTRYKDTMSQLKLVRIMCIMLRRGCQVNFNQARHGIYRDIPVINNVSREDGSTSRIQARVTNIKTYGEKGP